MRNIVFFLNGERGLSVVEAVVEAGHDVVAVVTPPGLDSGFVARLTKSAPSALLELSNVNEPHSVSRLSFLNPSLFIVAGFSTVFRPPLLKVPLFGTLNLHAGKLPEYRGGSPLNWQLINGEQEAGISVIQADDGIDTGPVLGSAVIPIESDTTISDLHLQANALFPKLVLGAIRAVEAGETGARQMEESAAYWHQRSDLDGRIFFRDMTAKQVDLFVRALTKPYGGAWCDYQNKVLRIFLVEIPSVVLKGAPGRICFIQGRGPYVICADRGVLLTDYAIENDETSELRHGSYLE